MVRQGGIFGILTLGSSRASFRSSGSGNDTLRYIFAPALFTEKIVWYKLVFPEGIELADKTFPILVSY